MKKRLITIWLLCLLVLPGNARAKTITAASCSQEDVQAAILGDAQAGIPPAEDGDTVIVPAGTCTWTSGIIITPMPAITIQGAGIDDTIIIDDTENLWKETPFWITGVDGKPFRITGITFRDTGIKDANGTIMITGNCKNWRVDNCKFDEINSRGIRVMGYTYGVIDHCIFKESAERSVQAIGILGDGDASWQRALSLGTSEAVYIEDCSFDFAWHNDGPLDAYDGARVVFRHNSVTNSTSGNHGRDSGPYRSAFSFEIYENTFHADISVNDALIWRGGSGLVFNNIVTGLYQSFNRLVYHCACPEMYICEWDKCVSYPCQDQVGRSTDQTLNPIYAWNNSFDEEDRDISVDDRYDDTCDPDMGYYIQEDRDYYNDVPEGLYASIPSTCEPYEAYWATDENRLYKCTATDSWEAYYTPYTYPHPLTLTGGGLAEDVTGDGEVNALDIQACVNHVLMVQDWGSAADVNNSGSVDAVDIQAIVNEVLRI